ncbi:lipopolysaccharide export system protein LptA [Litoreibacter ponti]|uniref:Lipopolysaccharide export system protein LptA n=1 Tax=Litoreibacter ponti TaxID=1510457 RepID=A0A2T6BPB8_9RHOB|nr:lipopolysaccharide transport periplasmic protein LptA [Litoreibacter ponti]PTX57911.1 lipopolysaccharide export system protein LptA [Litoreibacter ponti]
MKVFTAAALVLALGIGSAFAQGASVAFGGLQHDASLPVEITADELTVDQATGSAVFSGNVVAGQGEMRLSAARVQVEYATQNGQATGQINQLVATGGVTLVNGAEAAEAQRAVYAVGSGEIVMTGDVVLTQGVNALSGEKLTVDLNTGSGRMEGRVRTIFQTGGNN